jgi:NitT/TauT family transport system ATP-binding protein
VTLVRLEGAEVIYPGRGVVLGPIDLALSAGEAVAIVGASGSGKSTALRLLAGLEPPSRGAVERNLGPGETSVVFQAPTLAPWMSTLANVALPLTLAGVPRASAQGRALAALDRVGLASVAASRPAQLSGGMAMRAALARALVTRPRAMLLDEPFAALDEITRRDLADDLLRLWAETGAAMVFVTHNVEEAVYMGARVLVLSRGPGRIAVEAATPTGLPRSAGFRATPEFRSAAEAVSAALKQASEAA